MRALWLEDGHLRLRDDLPVPQPDHDEALVAVRLAGVCGTDLGLVRGLYPFTGVPGHEFVGEIMAAPASPERVGERVVAEINVACGSCPTCRGGRSAHCDRRTVLGIRGRPGAFAEQLCVPLANLHHVPDALADEAAVFAEPVAAACEILEQVTFGPADRVLVVGAGRLGQLIAQVLSTSGCPLRVVVRHAVQRALLAARGIETISEASVPGHCADVVIEATGSPGGLTLALRSVRPRGTVVLKSTYAGDSSIDPGRLVVDEITLIGSRCGPFPAALELLGTAEVEPIPLVAARLPLERGLEAFEQAARPGALKVLLQP